MCPKELYKDNLDDINDKDRFVSFQRLILLTVHSKQEIEIKTQILGFLF